MDDEADIRLVDAHAKGNGGHDHAGLIAHEAILHRLAQCLGR